MALEQMVGGLEERVFRTCCLQMILFYSMMQMWSNSFMFVCYFFVFRPWHD